MIYFLILFVVILIPIYTYNRSKFTISKGTHSKAIEWCPHFGIKEMTRKVIFDQSCKYVDRSGENDWNKAFGFSYGRHHKNSIRIGWRCKDPGVVETCVYYYIGGARRIKLLGAVECNEPHTFKIKVLKDTIEVNRLSANGKIALRIAGVYTPKVGYYLYPFFGGQDKAPHNMKLRIYR